MLLQEKHDLPLTGMTLAVNLGIKDETEASSGYAHLLEHMLLFGAGAAAGMARPAWPNSAATALPPMPIPIMT